jgi:hypothetical protein
MSYGQPPDVLATTMVKVQPQAQESAVGLAPYVPGLIEAKVRPTCAVPA